MSSHDPKDHRRHPRLSRPFDGSWRGASGGSTCRITDLSVGGCYVQSMGTPSKGEETVVTIKFGDGHSLSFTGHVVYAETGMGFAVEFAPLSPEAADELRTLIDALRGQAS